MKDRHRAGLVILLVVIFALQAKDLLNAVPDEPGSVFASVTLSLLMLLGIWLFMID